jgi:cobalt/nickel transport system permease protein
MSPPEAKFHKLADTRNSGLSARVRLAATLALVLFTTVLPRHLGPIYLVPLGMLLVAWPISGMPLWFGLKRLLMVEFFILGMGLLTLLRPAAAPLFLAALAKSNLCVLALLILTWTTPFSELVQVLRRWRMPAILLTTVALMYRYLPVLAEESRRMQRARASRTFSGRRSLAWGNLSSIIGQLFIRSAERAERIYLAMCARGWK